MFTLHLHLEILKPSPTHSEEQEAHQLCVCASLSSLYPLQDCNVVCESVSHYKLHVRHWKHKEMLGVIFEPGTSDVDHQS